VFTIQSPPQKGRLEASGRVLAGGDSFTQADIRAGRIVYRHGGGNDTADSFTFTVKDPAGNQTAVEVCDLTIVPVDDDAPVIEKHSLQVTQAAAVVIDTGSLFATDTDSVADNLSFVLKSTPSRGSLAKDGRLLAVDSVFTLTDIVQGRISYAHGGDAAASDVFNVLARDLAGNNSAITAVDVTVAPTEEAPFVRYAVAPDQAMQFHGRNVFELDTNVRRASAVRVVSADDTLIAPGDVSVEQTAEGKLRVTVRHSSNEFGVTALRFATADGRVFAQIVVIVEAPPTATWPQIGVLSGEQGLKRLDDGSVQSERTLNARWPGMLLRDGILNAAETFRMVRSIGPVGSANAAISDDADELNEVVTLQDDESGEHIKTWRSRTRISESYKTPESADAKARGYETSKDPYGDELIYWVSAPLPEVLGGLGAHDPLGVLLAFGDMAFDDDAVGGVVDVAMALLRAYVAKLEFRVRRPGYPPSPDDPRLAPEGETSMRESLLQTVDAVDTLLLIGDLPRLVKKLPKLLPAFVDEIRDLVKEEKKIKAAWKATKMPLELMTSVRDAIDAVSQLWGRLVGRHAIGGSQDGTDSARLEADREFIGALATVSSQYTMQIGGELRSFATPSESSNLDLTSKFGAAADQIEIQGQLIAEYLPGALPELSDLPVIPPPKVESGTPSNGTSPDDPDVDPATREANDENGDEEQKINDEILKQTDKVAKFVGTGKKVYDLLGSTRELVGNFGALLDLLGGDSGDYVDHDGQTYNVNEAQHRFGKAERDVINTGRRNDVVYAYGGDDRVTTGDGHDEVYAGAGRNHVFAGAGRDLIKDGEGDGMLSAGPGDDTIYPGAGSDYVSGDTGRDVYMWDGRDVGVDLIVDPSRSGELRLLAFQASELALSKDNYDLVLELPKSPSGEANRVRLAGYFEQDAAGWTVTFADGIARNLYELTGRLTAYDSLQIAFGARTAPGAPDYPAGIAHLTTLHDASGRFTLHVASDNRLSSGTPAPASTVPGADILRPGLVLTIEGDASLDGWLNRNRFGSLADSNDLLSRFKQAFAFGDYSRVTIVGIGEGGLPAQWFATAAASDKPAFVNTQLINSPDLSGLISQVVRDEFPEYEHGARSLSTNFLVDAADWVSQIAIWSGEGRVRGTWKAFDFDYDPAARPEALSQLDELQRAHAPAPGSVDFAKLKVSDLRLSHINGIVRLEDTNDFLQAVANSTTTIDGVAYDSTVSSLDVLIDEASLSSVTDQDVVEGARDRARFSSQLRHEPLAVDPSKPLIASYDFGTSDSPYDPTTSVRITSESRYPGVAAGMLAAGWQATNGLKAIDRGRASEFERDAILVGDGVFQINVKPGTYNVAVTYGDRETLREDVQLYLNGVAADRVTTMPGDFLTRTYQVTTTDGSLSLRFVDIGGKTDVGAIVGVSLEQVNFGAELPITEAMESDPAVIVMLEDYELPESNAGIEILKSALIAAATAVLTVGAGAILGITQIGGSIAAGLGGDIASGAAASGTSIVVAGTQEVVRAGIVAGFKATIGGAIKNAVLTSLVTSIPQNLVPNDTFRGIWSAGISLFAGIQGIRAGAPHEVDGVYHPRDWLVQADGAMKTLNGGLTAANTVLASLQGGADEQLAPWIYDFASSFAMMSRGFRAGRIDPAFVPVDVDEVLQALANGKSGKQLLRRWQGSRDYLVPDWLPDGEELTDVSEQEHREHVRRGSRAIVSLLTAYTETMRKTNPEAQLDVMFVAAGAAYDLVK
ncbi:MAG TPA: cadherin-like domain-containing protein, partial [Pirellulaceae bacterium]|nr:cadherin-like domain-containing protein [Pirellulaceae bacterium]